MPDDPHDLQFTDFRERLLLLRGRAGLSQREPAALTGASERAIQTWEAGLNYPSADRLKALIALYLQRGVFAPGREREEAVAVWEAARAEATRLQAPFDPAWFAALRASAPAAPPPSEAATEHGPATRARVVPLAPRGQDWGEAPDVGALYGRERELELLTRWVLTDRCRLVALLGMGGIGKTTLAAQVGQELAPQFDSVYWRSLRNAPPLEEWLAGAILFLSSQQAVPPEGEDARLRRLLELLRERRCLLVLDNLETVLEPGGSEAAYRAGYEGYGRLLQTLGEVGHQSCLLVTSREKPIELGILEGDRSAVRTLRLEGLGDPAGRALLADRGLAGDPTDWATLVARYGGNALALRVVGETIREVFGGDIAAFLTTGQAVFGNVRRLLEGQLARLSETERAVVGWLAVEREPVTFGELDADLGPATSPSVTLEAVEALRRRSLLERGEQGATFTLQPVVLEYATDQLVEQTADEIVDGQPHRLVRYALVKAPAKEYVRRSQERLIGVPLLHRLAAVGGDVAAAEHLLRALLEDWRGRPAAEQGYGPGNVVNLLRASRGHLRGLDLSHLELRQAYLAVEAQGTSLAGAHLAEAVLAEPFGAMLCMALSAEGTYIAAGTLSGQVRVWRVMDRAPILAVEAHAGTVWGVALSADGQRAASGGADATVRLWETATGQCVSVLRGHTRGVCDVALSRDGERVASGGADGTVRLWDARSNTPVRTLHRDRPYERMDVTGLTGVTDAQRAALLALGAVDRADPSPLAHA